ncbi:MAG: DUF3343 domain-containing protein [Clostridia bacterium]|nr:DUF3343 domain-containing protein [Clostridia bacterium]
MEYFIIATASRTDAISLNYQLKAKGVRASVVSTPKEAKIGCGLSVKILSGDYFYALRLIKTAKVPSITGIFKVTETFEGKVVMRL